MLKLSNPIVFTKAEQDVISTVKASGKSGPDMWKDDVLKPIKNTISQHTLEEQGCRCAFCEALLVKGTTAIEHIAPKGKHPKFTFEPLNLVSACGRCNSTAIKGQKETIIHPVNTDYSQNSFAIVHPRLDGLDVDIKFTDDTRIAFDKQNCSQKGLDTIAFFHWDDEDARLTRLLNANRANIPINIQQYAALVSTYK